MVNGPTILYLPDQDGRFYTVEIKSLEASWHRVRAIVQHLQEIVHYSDWELDPAIIGLPLSGAPKDQNKHEAWFRAGVTRMYLRRFPAIILAEQGLKIVVNREQLQAYFVERPDGDALARIERDLERILVDLGTASGDELVNSLDGSTDEWLGAQPTLERKQRQGDPRIGSIYSDIENFYTELSKARQVRADKRTTRMDALCRRLIALGHPLLLDIIASGRSQAAPSDNGYKPWPGDRAAHIHRISLEGLRCFDRLDLDLTAPSDQRQGQWLVLLGNNGHGKTTLLRALSLALMPHKASQNHLYELSQSAKLIRHRTPRAEVEIDIGTQAKAHIRLELDGSTESVRSVRALSNSPLILGYGCRRGSALGDREGTLKLSPLNGCDTLFDEHANLANAHYWLLTAQKKHPGPFEALRETLKRVLKVDAIDLDADTVWVTGPRIGRVPLAGLSDGYLTTLGWVVDMMARWWTYAEQSGFTLPDSFNEHMPCIVLIDEIDLHLHPRWQTEVVKRLRSLFPMTTFIATSHNPLALTGLEPHEIVILRPDESSNRIIAEQPRERPDLLTGSEIYETFFGIQRLHIGKLQRYGFLAGDPYRSDDEDAEMRRLHDELKNMGLEPEWQPVERESQEEPPA